jgi:peptidoglycan/LPS O-acetylase OafA/YrhL
LNLEKVQLIGNLLMLQDVSVLKRGVWIDTYYGNSPLWSLSYEWWFYMLFIPMGLNKTAWMQDRLGSALFISTIGFLGYQFIPNPFCLFAGYCFIWWAGVELAREFVKNGNLSFRGQTWTLVGLALMTILWGVPVLLRAVQHEPLQLGIDPVLQCRHYLAALIFVTTGILIAKWGRVETFSWIMRPFMLLAPISYAIYVTHQPLLNLAREFANSSSQWLTALIAFPIVLLLGWLLEIRMQASVSRYFLKKRSILKPA